MQMTLEVWQALTGVVVTLFGAGWAIFKYLSGRFQKLDDKMTKQHDERSRQHDNHKEVISREFAGLRQTDATLGNNISQLRLEVTREQQNFVTRAELDRRIERLEDETREQSGKLDEILRRVVK